MARRRYGPRTYRKKRRTYRKRRWGQSNRKYVSGRTRGPSRKKSTKAIMKRPPSAIAPYRTPKRRRTTSISRKRKAPSSGPSYLTQFAQAAIGAAKYAGPGDLVGFISRRFGKRPRANPMVGVPTMMHPTEPGRNALPAAAQFYQAYKSEL